MAAPFVSAAQTRPDNDKQDRVMTVKEMKHDINYYFKTLRDMHPHPYAHYTKAQMDSVEKALYKHCSKPLPFSEFAYQLYKTKKYVDEHTGIDYNISLTEEQYANFFPLTTIEKGNIMLGENVIHAINGISSSKILNELDLLFSWERHPQLREKNMNLQLSYVLYHSFQAKPPFTCSMQKSGSTNLIDTIIQPVESGSLHSQSRAYKERYSRFPLKQEIFEDDSIAVLFYNTSNITTDELKPYITKEYLEEFTDDFFQYIIDSDIKYLFIDVSQNGGGSDNAHEYIYRYLNYSPSPSKVYITATKKGAKKAYEFYKSRIQEDTTTLFRERFEKVYQSLMKHGEYVEEDEPMLLLPVPTQEKFKGKVYVIMNNSFSAACDFCRSMKSSEAGILVGEECKARSPFSANLIFEKLPESDILFYYPTSYVWYEKKILNRDGFLLPDIPYSLDKLLEVEDYKEIIRLSDEMGL